jgi:hypothetical protein
MRTASYFMVSIAIGMFLGTDIGSRASAKTVEAGDASTSWIGTGEIYDLADEGQVIHAIVKGVLIVRHFKGEIGRTVHTSKLVCPIRVTVNARNNHRTQLGLCTIIAHGGKDVAYGQWKCDGDLNECEGEFTFTHGAGGFSGISGTTPMFNRIIFEKLEAGNARAVGYASWPNLTYSLP